MHAASNKLGEYIDACIDRRRHLFWRFMFRTSIACASHQWDLISLLAGQCGDVSQTRPTAQGQCVTDRWRFQWIGMRWIFLPSNPLSVLLIESTRRCHLQTKTAKLRKTCHSSSSISMPSYSGNLDTTGLFILVATTNSVLRFTFKRDTKIWERWIWRKNI